MAASTEPPSTSTSTYIASTSKSPSTLKLYSSTVKYKYKYQVLHLCESLQKMYKRNFFIIISMKLELNHVNEPAH